MDDVAPMSVTAVLAVSHPLFFLDNRELAIVGKKSSKGRRGLDMLTLIILSNIGVADSQQRQHWCGVGKTVNPTLELTVHVAQDKVCDSSLALIQSAHTRFLCKALIF